MTRIRPHVVDAIAEASPHELIEGLSARRDTQGDVGFSRLSGGIRRLTVKLRDGVAPVTIQRTRRRSHARAIENVHDV